MLFTANSYTFSAQASGHVVLLHRVTNVARCSVVSFYCLQSQARHPDLQKSTIIDKGKVDCGGTNAHTRSAPNRILIVLLIDTWGHTRSDREFAGVRTKECPRGPRGSPGLRVPQFHGIGESPTMAQITAKHYAVGNRKTEVLVFVRQSNPLPSAFPCYVSTVI